MPIEQGGILALLMKWKVLAYLSALAGALVIAAVEPPKTRKDLFKRVATAMVASALFGGFAVSFLHSFVPDGITKDDLIAPVYGVIGSLGWAIASALNVFGKKLATNPKEAIQDVKDVV